MIVKNIPIGWTSQQVFNHVVKHLREQGAKCMVSRNCRYRDWESGRACAVGCLIPEEVYQDDMEHCGVDVLVEYADIDPRLRSVLEQHVNLLRDLQKIHDEDLVDDWEESFAVVAEKYNLEMP